MTDRREVMMTRTYTRMVPLLAAMALIVQPIGAQDQDADSVQP